MSDALSHHTTSLLYLHTKAPKGVKCLGQLVVTTYSDTAPLRSTFESKMTCDSGTFHILTSSCRLSSGFSGRISASSNGSTPPMIAPMRSTSTRPTSGNFSATCLEITWRANGVHPLQKMHLDGSGGQWRTCGVGSLHIVAAQQAFMQHILD